MSALLAPNPRIQGPKTRRSGASAAPTPERPRLRPLPSAPRRMARLPFLAVLIAAFGVGMAGLLMLNTTLQNQAFEARTLNRQVNELTYVQSDLEGQLDAVSAPASLAQKASTLGMRANPYPAFLVLPDGTVVGRAKVVKGDEVPELVVLTPEQLAVKEAAERAAAAAKAKAKAEAAALAQVTAAQAEAEAARTQAAADAAQAKADAAAKQAAAKKAAQKKAAEQKKKAAERGDN